MGLSPRCMQGFSCECFSPSRAMHDKVCQRGRVFITAKTSVSQKVTDVLAVH